MNPFLGTMFMFITLIIAVPSAVKTFNYLATLWRGNLKFTPGMMFAIGLVSFFVSGGLTGLFLANAALDIAMHDTYFVVAHFHLVMGSSAIFGMFAGIYHWYPRMFGRRLNESLGHLHFWLTFVSAYLVFFPMHFMGLAGVPRRYYMFTVIPEFEIWADVNVMITIAAIVGSVAQIIFLWNFFSNIFRGEKSEQNPWKSNTLEWTAPLEGIHGNWPGAIPTVYRGAYEYSRPDREEDYYPQHIPGDDDGVYHPESEQKATIRKETVEVSKDKEIVYFTALRSIFGLNKG